MRVNSIAWCGSLVALSMCVSLPPAQGGDHKDSGLLQDVKSRVSDTGATFSSSVRHSPIAALFVTNSDSKFSRSRPEATKKEKDSGPTPPNERKKIILFRFDPKFGDVSVQPVVGQVNGAQLSVGW
jgi:hypothetical protein